MRISIIGLIVCAAACGQDPKLIFEVASIKPSTASGAYFDGGPGSKDPSQFTFVNGSFGALLRMAYAANSYQVAAPAGLPDARFDIKAKIPPGTTQGQFEVMLQSLLIERFGMKVHHETREVQGYELTVPKGSMRLMTAKMPMVMPPDVPVGRLPLTKDSHGDPQLPAGRNARLVIPLADGRYRFSGRMQTLTDIVAMCARELGKPVVDRSGLLGVYDFNIDFARRPDDRSEPDDAGSPFLAAFQMQTGLRLESKKVSIDMIVIDHIEKTPTDN